MQALHWAGLAAVLLVTVAGLLWQLRPVQEFKLESRFYRDGAGTREPLQDGMPIALGDKLRLEIAAAQPTWIYVFNDDGSPEPTVLYPLPGVAPGNPLTPGTRWQLPGHDGLTGLSWQVDSEAERETFVVISSPRRLSQVEDSIAQWRHVVSPDNPYRRQ